MPDGARLRHAPAEVETVPVPRPGAGPVAVQRLHTPAEVEDVIETMGRTARTEVLGMVPYEAAAANLHATRDGDLGPLGRGVPAFLICEASCMDDPAVRREIEGRAEAGARIRVVDRVSHWMALVDGRVAVLPAAKGRAEPGALVVRERPVVRSLRALFASTWRRSTDPARQPVCDDQACSDRDLRVIKLMGRGTTDDASAREMDVSVRTYRRYVADVMLALGATSRFQAGVVAASRGWL